MKDLWYEEDLVPAQGELDEIFRKEKGPYTDSAPSLRVLIGKIWPLEKISFRSRGFQHLCLLRLRIMFETNKAHLVYAKCSVRLTPVPPHNGQPIVYDVYPLNLYEGEPQTVEVKLGAGLKAGIAEIELGSVSWSGTAGQIQPVVVGYPGPDETTAHWELYPKRGTNRLGRVQDFWLAVAAPPDCPKFALAVMVEGTAQISERRFFVRSKKQAWDVLPKFTVDKESFPERKE